ncbi:hypothetical protein PQU92_11475 [Asticcacaulis sp. BYS171W]|uniref:DUF2796 domain-containing protein n=1 Tax=Asticcacaulis aquaticus TaxID=2984212 RepID=A0ABT5HV19_9CAUL|nr:hypothetical protein [Asticcacaulis aquaticus]
MLVGCASLLLASPALAHRGHHTLTVVEIDATGKVTITHNLSAHDTEPELVELAPDAQPSVDDPDAFKALEAHLATAFKVNGQTFKPVSNDMAGDDIILVYGGKLPKAPKSVTIDYGLFPYSRQTGVGLVNVRVRGVTKSLTFAHGSAPQTATFD